jgi:WD40 repeat protein
VGTLEGHTDCVKSVAFNGAGNMLASGSCDNTINLTRIYTKKFVKTALLTMNRHMLVDDVIDNIMEKLGVIDKKGNITGCMI